MIDLSALRLLLLTITGWLQRRQREALAYLVEENDFEIGRALRNLPALLEIGFEANRRLLCANLLATTA